MITRQFLEERLPDSHVIQLFAQNISGINFDEADAVEKALLWMILKQKQDKYVGLRDLPSAWDNHKGQYPWEIKVHGLSYKSEDEYLTLEGWPLGTTCWYVCFEAGFKEYIAGDNPRMALIRAIIAIQCYQAMRELGPVPHLGDAIEHFTKGFK